MSQSPSNLPSPGVALDVLKLRIAVQLAPRRWRDGLERLTSNLEAGAGWEEAVAHCSGASGRLKSLVAAAVEAGHPADITLAILRRRANMLQSWQQMVSALLYPTLLLFIALIVGSFTGLTMMKFTNDPWDIGSTSGLVRDFNDTAIGALLIMAWSLLMITSAYFLASPQAWLKLVGATPLVGRPYRWLAMSELLSRVSVFSQYRPQLPEALRMTARSYGTDALSTIAEHIANEVEQGKGFRAALHHTILSDERAGVTLTLIEMDSVHFSDSLVRASLLLEQMSQYLCTRLKLVYPVFVLLAIASLVWGAWASYIAIFKAISNSFM